MLSWRRKQWASFVKALNYRNSLKILMNYSYHYGRALWHSFVNLDEVVAELEQ
jgi:hypothetical protein